MSRPDLGRSPSEGDRSRSPSPSQKGKPDWTRMAFERDSKRRHEESIAESPKIAKDTSKVSMGASKEQRVNSGQSPDDKCVQQIRAALKDGIARYEFQKLSREKANHMDHGQEYLYPISKLVQQIVEKYQQAGYNVDTGYIRNNVFNEGQKRDYDKEQHLLNKQVEAMEATLKLLENYRFPRRQFIAYGFGPHISTEKSPEDILNKLNKAREAGEISAKAFKLFLAHSNRIAKSITSESVSGVREENRAKNVSEATNNYLADILSAEDYLKTINNIDRNISFTSQRKARKKGAIPEPSATQ